MTLLATAVLRNPRRQPFSTHELLAATRDAVEHHGWGHTPLAAPQVTMIVATIARALDLPVSHVHVGRQVLIHVNADGLQYEVAIDRMEPNRVTAHPPMPPESKPGFTP